MGVPKISFILIPLIVVLATLSQVSYAQDSQQDYLNAHNAARSQVGVGAMTWNTVVANYAQSYVNKLKGSCNMVHSGGPYGENHAGSTADLTGTAAVKMWVDEKQYYNNSTNLCASGDVCTQFTKVVRSNSVRLGCGKVKCDNGGTLISCNYNGQKPY